MAGLKGTLYAANPKTGEVESFKFGTARKDLPDWVTVDDGAFDADPESEASSPPYPAGDPSEDWKGAELDAYAAEKSVDVSAAKNKAEKVAALLAAQK